MSQMELRPDPAMMSYPQDGWDADIGINPPAGVRGPMLGFFSVLG